MTQESSAFHLNSVEMQGELYNELASVRTKLAKRHNTLAMYVANNTTLAEIAQFRPCNIEQLATLHGMNLDKAEKYGRAILDVVDKHSKKYVEKNEYYFTHKRILQVITEGVDPRTGEAFPTGHILKDERINESLRLCLDLLETLKKEEDEKSLIIGSYSQSAKERREDNVQNGKPVNHGMEWTKKECVSLTDVLSRIESFHAKFVGLSLAEYLTSEVDSNRPPNREFLQEICDIILDLSFKFGRTFSSILWKLGELEAISPSLKDHIYRHYSSNSFQSVEKEEFSVSEPSSSFQRADKEESNVSKAIVALKEFLRDKKRGRQSTLKVENAKDDVDTKGIKEVKQKNNASSDKNTPLQKSEKPHSVKIKNPKSSEKMENGCSKCGVTIPSFLVAGGRTECTECLDLSLAPPPSLPEAGFGKREDYEKLRRRNYGNWRNRGKG